MRLRSSCLQTRERVSAAAVVENGEYEWSQGYGMADLENFVPATARTMYRLASLSKPLTATAAMQLWERGKLNLDAPVQNYCPTFPQKEWPITTRQVLGHLGGIRHYRTDSQDDPEVGNTKHFEDGIAAGLRRESPWKRGGQSLPGFARRAS